MIVKVKEPQPAECPACAPGQVLFTYLHLAPTPHRRGAGGKRRRVHCLDGDGGQRAASRCSRRCPKWRAAWRSRPAPTSSRRRTAARASCSAACPACAPGKVVILGGGVVGTHAPRSRVGMGANVTVLDRSPDAMRRCGSSSARRCKTEFSTRDAVERHVVRGRPGDRRRPHPRCVAPKLVTAGMVRRCSRVRSSSTSRSTRAAASRRRAPTTHADPTYVVDGVIHYCVANMPGGVPRTSTFALNNATLPCGLALADKGWRPALAVDPHLRDGLNVALGQWSRARRRSPMTRWLSVRGSPGTVLAPLAH